MKKSKKREDLLDAAEALFYKQGFHTIGIKQILNEANVATMTMYNHFDSKEELITEVLKRREKIYFDLLKSHTSGQTDVEAYIESLIDFHVDWLVKDGFNGCLFLRAKQEYEGINEDITSLSVEYKQKLIDKISQDLSSLNMEDNYSASMQITLILEGATSMFQILGTEVTRRETKKVVSKLIGK
ncbi:TetR/AcrR family transcriptional regulator [Oceanobacillus kimchii]|uniref:TetR/AcrR family transcriptional regulator n=1 Tax=Oceanobacillus kimchii TaxID=746691 RepID=UPI0009866C4E|nr:TetR/AcrR family transcriptional regulator [Oceanobacillus kimchii]